MQITGSPIFWGAWEGWDRGEGGRGEGRGGIVGDFLAWVGSSSSLEVAHPEKIADLLAWHRLKSQLC